MSDDAPRSPASTGPSAAPDDAAVPAIASTPGAADAPPEPPLHRRPAIDYHLTPEGDSWFKKAFQAATPGLTFLTTTYQRSWLNRDVIAGVAVAAYLVPQVMAYSAIVGVPASTALWTALISMLVYAVVGGSRVLSVGPESTIALLAGVSVAPLAQGDPQRVIALTAALSLIVAAWCFLGRMFRLGVVADLLSQPLLVGYLAGAAILMVVGQLGKLTGTSVHGESIVEQFTTFLSVVSQTHMATLIVGLATLAAILGLHWVAPKWPSALIGVVGAIVAYVVLDLQSLGVAVVGEVPSGFPVPSLPLVTWAELKVLLIAGLGVAVMAYSDNMLIARGFPAPSLPGERPSDKEVDPQSELVALGTVHLAVGAIGGFPVSSSGSRTALALASRARTQVYSLAASVVVVLVLVVAGKITALLPQAALGAVVVYAATKLVSLRAFVRLKRFRRRELLLALITLFGTVIYGILAGVGLAVALSLLEMGQRLARPHSAVLGRVPGIAGMHDVRDYPTAETLPGLVIYRYDAPLFFANIGDLRRHAQRIIDEEHTAYPETRLRWFLINVEAITEIDITASDGLKEMQGDLAAQGILLGLVRIKRDLYEPLKRSGVVDLIGEDMLFPTLPVAEQAYLTWAAAHPMEPVDPEAALSPEHVPDSLQQAWTGSAEVSAPQVESAAHGADVRVAPPDDPRQG